MMWLQLQAVKVCDVICHHYGNVYLALYAFYQWVVI